MEKGKLIGQIFGIAVVPVLIGALLGGAPSQCRAISRIFEKMNCYHDTYNSQ